MSYIQFHIKELFFRALYPIIFFILGFVLVSQYFIVFLILLISHSGISLALISSPYEALSSFLFGSAFVAGLVVAVPLGIIQIYLYIRPALFFNSNLSVFYFDFFLSTFAFFFPVLCLFLALHLFPYVLNLLLSPYSHLDLSRILYWLPNISSILTIYSKVTIGIGILINIPIILGGIQKLYGNKKKESILKKLMEKRQYLLFGLSLIISLFTPPDLITLIIITIPLIIIIEGTYMITIMQVKYGGLQ